MTRFNAAPKWSSSLRLQTSDPTERSVATPPDSAAPSRVADHLIDVVQRLSFALNMEEIVNIVRTAARQLTGADGASFVLRDGNFCFYVDEDAIAPLWKGQRFPLEMCISGWVMNTGESVTIPNVFLDPRIPVEAYRPTFVRSMAMVPIQPPIRTQSPVGAIGSYWATTHRPTSEQLRILQALADSTAVAMENVRIHQELEERLRQRTEELEAANTALRNEAVLRKQMEAKVVRLSLTDELTGLNNRRGFLLQAEQLLKLVHRVHTQGWIIYIDLDGLKQVNRTLGHDAGDQLIVSAAKVLRESFRDSDVIGRIGGDEFVVFATGPSTPALEIQERITQNIEHRNRCFPNDPPLTMSIGVIRCEPHSLNSLDDMIHQADAAMYIEKRRKRERLRNSLE